MLTSKRLPAVVIAMAAALVAPGLAVAQDVSAQAGQANGTELVLWDCHLHPDQRWY